MKSLSLIEGRLATDPVYFVYANDNNFCTFKLAVRAIIEGKEAVSIITINCYNKVAEIANMYLMKGTKIRAKGYLKRLSQIVNKDSEKVINTKLAMDVTAIDFLADTKEKTI